MADVPLMENPMTAVADSIIGGASGAPTRLKNNLSAAAAPTVNEDSGDGYAIGSRWIDTTADKEYVALDVTVGAAVWTETTGAAGSAAAVGARVHNSTTQSIPDSTGPVLTFDTEDFDTDGFHTGSGSALTVPSGLGGIYLVSGGTFFASSGAGSYRIIAITKNGAAVAPHMRRGVAPTDPALALSVVIALVPTDYVEIIAFQNSGGALNVGHASTAEFQSTLSLVRLGT